MAQSQHNITQTNSTYIVIINHYHRQTLILTSLLPQPLSPNTSPEPICRFSICTLFHFYEPHIIYNTAPPVNLQYSGLSSYAQLYLYIFYFVGKHQAYLVKPKLQVDSWYINIYLFWVQRFVNCILLYNFVYMPKRTTK